MMLKAFLTSVAILTDVKCVMSILLFLVVMIIKFILIQNFKIGIPIRSLEMGIACKLFFFSEG